MRACVCVCGSSSDTGASTWSQAHVHWSSYTHKANLLFLLLGLVCKPTYGLTIYIVDHLCPLHFSFCYINVMLSFSRWDAFQYHSNTMPLIVKGWAVTGMITLQPSVLQGRSIRVFSPSGQWRRDRKSCYLRVFSHRSCGQGQKQLLQYKKVQCSTEGWSHRDEWMKTWIKERIRSVFHGLLSVIYKIILPGLRAPHDPIHRKQ